MNPWKLVTALVAATIVLDVWSLLLFPRPAVGTEIVAAALMVAQVCLSAIWLAMGRMHWLIRVTWLTAVILFWAALYRGPGTAEMATILSVFAGGMLCVAFLGRIRGIVWTSPSDRATETNRQELQFSLARLFGWMTVIAILAALSRYAEFRGIGGEVLIMVPLLIGTTLAAAWLASVAGNIILRVAGTITIALIAGVLFNGSLNPPQYMDILGFYVIQALFVFGWVAALRTVGVTIHRIGTAQPTADVTAVPTD